MKMKILVVCTYNSVRSQMAEGFFRHLAGGRIDVVSAGVHATGPSRLAIAVMREYNIDISAQPSKSIAVYRGEVFDFVMTFSPEARDACLTAFPESVLLYWPERDPNLEPGTEEERLRAFRKVRDRIKERIETFLKQHS